MTDKLIIDGSHGEGGGQILRSPVDTLFKVKLISLVFSYPTDAGIA
ncbi:MAG: hypothetical protein Q8L15_06235 [Methylobacter sp.]|nr:hypothetical protein [Methylobacter sp.]